MVIGNCHMFDLTFCNQEGNFKKDFGTFNSTELSKRVIICTETLLKSMVGPSTEYNSFIHLTVFLLFRVDTPVFMPVGTQGTLKGIVPKQLENLGNLVLFLVFPLKLLREKKISEK